MYSINDEIIPYKEKLEIWASKELQLKMLHEELISKHEFLLRTSKNYLQRFPYDDLPLNNDDATIRNNSLLQAIYKDKQLHKVECVSSLEDKINDSLSEQLSPRFVNLQANYWSMVRNMFPIWKKSLEELKMAS